MSGRKITYDEIVLEVMARSDLTDEQRREVLLFLRDFRANVSSQLMASFPEEIRDMVTIHVS